MPSPGFRASALTSLGFWALAPAIERHLRRLPGLWDETVFFEFGLCSEGALVRVFYPLFPPSFLSVFPPLPSFARLSASLPPYPRCLPSFFVLDLQSKNTRALEVYYGEAMLKKGANPNLTARFREI